MAQETHQPNLGEVEANQPNLGGVQTDGVPPQNAVMQLETLVQAVADRVVARISEQSGASVNRAEGNSTTTGNFELIILDSCVAGFHT